MSFKEEIYQKLEEIQRKINNGGEVDQSELEILFLSSLIEEEGT